MLVRPQHDGRRGVLVVSVEGSEHVTAAIEQHRKRQVLRLRDFGLFQGDSEKPCPGCNDGLLRSDNSPSSLR